MQLLLQDSLGIPEDFLDQKSKMNLSIMIICMEQIDITTYCK